MASYSLLSTRTRKHLGASEGAVCWGEQGEAIAFASAEDAAACAAMLAMLAGIVGLEPCAEGAGPEPPETLFEDEAPPADEDEE